MRVTLLVKNKLGFVDGTCVKSSFRGDLATQWERCNAVVVSWLSSTVSAELVPSIMCASSARKVWDEFKERFDKDNLTKIYQLWTEIATLRQGTDSATSYFSKLKDLWDELDILAHLPSCDCEESRPYVEHLIRQKLLQFLMGLNESYSHVRSDVLLKRPVLSVNQAYAVVVQQERQRILCVIDSNKDPLNMLAAGKSQVFKSKRPGMICEHCGYKGHLKENCYKIIGYPPDFKSKKKGQYNVIKLFANTAITQECVIGKNQIQIQQGSTVSLLSNAQCYDWVVDSGASHHITFCKNILESIQSINRQSNDGVQTPTGSRSEITHTWDAIGLYNGKGVGIGREENGLYILRRDFLVSRDVSFREDIFSFKHLTEDNEDIFTQFTSTPIHSEGRPTHEGEHFSITGDRNIAAADEDNTASAGDIISEDEAHSAEEELPVAADQTRTKAELPIPTAANQTAVEPDGNHTQEIAHDLSDTSAPTTYSIGSLCNQSMSYLAEFSTVIEHVSFKEASKDSRWIEAMKQEVQALEDNKTWEIVELPPGKQEIGSK
nr:uncharacterized protein LOC117278435 [Nicotiana tomentosiformis]